MAQSNARILQFTIADISQLTKTWSPPITLYGIPWQFRIEKCEHSAKQSLGIYLHCVKQDSTAPDWTAVASASIKLVRHPLVPLSDQGEVIYFIPPFIFDRFTGGYGTNALIEWDKLLNRFNYFVHNDTIALEINIRVEDPNDKSRSALNFRRINKSCESCCQAIYEMTVKNVTNLMAIRSPRFEMRAKSYNIVIFKNDSWLGFRLQPNQVCGIITSYNVKMSIELKSFKFKAVPIERCGSVEEINIISWIDLFDPNNGYVANNSIVLKVGINVNDLIGDIADAEPIRRPLECMVCFTEPGTLQMSITPCRHSFCMPCITRAVHSHGTCPVCLAALESKDLRRLYPHL